VRILAYVGVWLACAVVAGLLLFLTSSRSVVVASHDAVIQPNLSGRAVLETGPVLPDVRVDAPGVVGVDIRLEKTDAASTDELVQRYAFIASEPEGQVAKVSDAVRSIALDAALRGAILGLLPVLVWLLVGPARRRDVAQRVRLPQAMTAVAVVVLLGVGLWQPWASGDTVESERGWVSLGEFLGP
jgi:hypothetical protein